MVTVRLYHGDKTRKLATYILEINHLTARITIDNTSAIEVCDCEVIGEASQRYRQGKEIGEAELIKLPVNVKIQIACVIEDFLGLVNI